jgi:pimeloyl-ACP methyl ester carboxylesterase
LNPATPTNSRCASRRPEPRTSLQIARELKGVLDAASEKGPFVLVGHSMGGFHVRVFAGQYAG